MSNRNDCKPNKSLELLMSDDDSGMYYFEVRYRGFLVAKFKNRTLEEYLVALARASFVVAAIIIGACTIARVVWK